MTPNFTIEELKEKIRNEQPKIIFLAGKSCTGKSTFAQSIEEFGYRHVEFDLIVRQFVRDKFKLDNSEAFRVYKGDTLKEWQESFEVAAKKLVEGKAKESKIVIDAAVADPKIIKRILNQDFMLIYFHPFNKDFYVNNILKRFSEDVTENKISFPLWDHITEEILSDYKTNGRKGQKISKLVNEYAEDRTKKSEDRFKFFKKEYPKIILTGHSEKPTKLQSPFMI